MRTGQDVTARHGGRDVTPGRRPGTGRTDRNGAAPDLRDTIRRTTHRWHVLSASTSRARSASRSHSPTSTASVAPAPKQALAATGVNPDIRVKDLSDEELVALRDYIEGNFKVEGDLRREVAADIRRKVEIGSYEGLRHRRGLPVRGQRTKTNARTRKGPKRTVAGKKKAGR